MNIVSQQIICIRRFITKGELAYLMKPYNEAAPGSSLQDGWLNQDVVVYLSKIIDPCGGTQFNLGSSTFEGV